MDRDTTLRALIENGLKRELDVRSASDRKIHWVNATGTWPSDLDLSSRKKMWDWLEQANDADEAGSRARP